MSEGCGLTEAGRPQLAPSPPAGHSCSIGWWQSRIPAASGLAQQAGADMGLSQAGATQPDPGTASQAQRGKGVQDPPVPSSHPMGLCPEAGVHW